MLTKDDLFLQNTLPHINTVSLKLYKDFSVDVLLKRKFHFYFIDGSEIIIVFKEWGIYHMLSIHHIDYTISKNKFFERIDAGLSFDDFTTNRKIKNRFREQKERITMFSCIYNILRYGRVFYVPNRNVPNTKNVSLDYLIYKEVSGKGFNLGIRFECGYFVPLTILVSKSINLNKYINNTEKKIVSKLVISELESNKVIENITYSDEFIMHN